MQLNSRGVYILITSLSVNEQTIFTTSSKLPVPLVYGTGMLSHFLFSYINHMEPSNTPLFPGCIVLMNRSLPHWHLSLIQYRA